MAFTRDANDYDNHQSQPDRPLIAASDLKILFDKAPNDMQTFNNDTHLSELEAITDGNAGADNIGATAVGVGTSTTVQGILEEQDVTAVKLIGNQTVAGIKTFSSSPIVPTATTSTQATNKGQVDTLDGANVKLTGNQTVAGVKTFSSSPIVPLTPTTSTQAPSKGYVDTAIAGVVLGQIPDNSITNVKLATDIKVGSLATLTTTEKASVVGAINETNQSVTNRDTALDGQVLTSNGDGTSNYETVDTWSGNHSLQSSCPTRRHRPCPSTSEF